MSCGNTIFLHFLEMTNDLFRSVSQWHRLKMVLNISMHSNEQIFGKCMQQAFCWNKFILLNYRFQSNEYFLIGICALFSLLWMNGLKCVFQKNQIQIKLWFKMMRQKTLTVIRLNDRYLNWWWFSCILFCRFIYIFIEMILTKNNVRNCI